MRERYPHFLSVRVEVGAPAGRVALAGRAALGADEPHLGLLWLVHLP